MFLPLSLLSCVLLTALAEEAELQLEKLEYKQFILKYRSGNEDATRKQNFLKNLRKMKAHNERFNKNEISYEMGVNEFTDWVICILFID